MTITLKLFAILRERANASEVTVDLPAGATVAEARQALAQRLPELASLLNRVAFAVNRTYASADTTLHEGDEVAVLPPVSGG